MLRHSLINATQIFFGSYLAMLFLGAAHSYDRRVPAFGYFTVTLLVFTVAVIPLSIRDTQVGGRLRDYVAEDEAKERAR